ncbi:MAG: ATP-binding protein [Rubrobacteraceae bacterium]
MSQVEDIIRYAREGAGLFHAPDGTAYAAVEVDGHLETHAIRSGRLRDWILVRFPPQRGRAPNSQLLNDALNTIRAIAVYHGPEMPVFVRVAEHEGDVYIDLGNENWDAVRVTREGYEVVPRPPVGFVRKAGFAPLPYPAGEGTIDELRPFLNIGSDGDFMLVAAWAAFSLSPRGPYPVLVLQGEQGSAKSTTVRVLRALVDAAVEPLRALPKNERDLAIAAGNAWVLAFDNLSGIRDQLSDALCRLATGGGFATRQLYTDDEEIIFSAKRPIILNGIDDIATRGDLQERSLLVSLPSIPEERRVEEAAFWADFQAAKPRIFGALLDGVSAALRNSEAVHLERKPRMADFAVGATAMEGAFGWEPGSFVEVYEANRQQASETLLANEPIAEAIEKLLEDGRENVWIGTATELLQMLGSYVNDSTKRSKAWPGGPQVLSRRLKRIAPALRSAGIEYTEHEQGHRKRKVKVLRKLVRGDEEAQDSGEEVREDEVDPEGEAVDGEEEHEEQADSDGEERKLRNPFEFNFDFDNPSEPEDQGAK